MEIQKTGIFINKQVYLGPSILQLSKTVMCEYDYVKPKYGDRAKLGYMDIDRFLVYIKTEDIYADIAQDVVARFDTSNYELKRPFPNGKNRKAIRLIKDELRSEDMKESSALTGTTHSYFTDNHDEDKKSKGTKRYPIKQKLKFKDYKHSLKGTQFEDKINQREKNKNIKEFKQNYKLIIKLQQRFRSKKHDLFTEQVTKISLSANDDK